MGRRDATGERTWEPMRPVDAMKRVRNVVDGGGGDGQEQQSAGVQAEENLVHRRVVALRVVWVAVPPQAVVLETGEGHHHVVPEREAG